MLTLLIGAVALSSASHAFTYTLTDLGADVYPYGINSSAHTAGKKVVSGVNRAYFHDGTNFTIIPLLPSGSGVNEARALNDNDVVTGWCTVSGTGDRAFRYTVGTATLEAISITPSPTWGLGINSSGTVSGWSSGDQKGFVWTTAPAVTTIAAPNISGVISFAVGINASGQVAGSAKFTISGLILAMHYSAPTYTQIGTTGQASIGLAINSNGHVAGTLNEGWPGLALGPLAGNGTSGIGATELAFYWDGTTRTTIAAAGSRALAINSSDDVVGADTNGAFIYSGGTLTDLNTLVSLSPGWFLTAATGINDSGEICGFGVRPKAGGGTEAFGFILS